MSDAFFEKPILNSPYEYPKQHWELDETGQPTTHVLPSRRPAKYLTPIPRAKKQKKGQKEMLFRDEKGISTEDQLYDPTPIINKLRVRVDAGVCSPRASGTSRRRRRASSTIGATTPSTASAPSSVRWRRWRPRSG